MARTAVAPACLIEMAPVARLATVIIAGLVWAVAGSGDAVAADQLFFTETVTRVGEDAVGLVAGDFDGDRRPDLVFGGVLGYATGELWRLPGSVDGRFSGRPRRTGLPSTLGGAVPRVVADFNGDGRADVANVEVNPEADLEERVAVGLGDGRGHFTASYRGSDRATNITIASLDFDGDHRLDIAELDAWDTDRGQIARVRLLRGDGRGGFAQRLLLSPEPDTLGDALLAGDVDGDGRDDIAVMGAPSAVTLLGTSAGAPRAIASGGGTELWPAVLADLDGDGHLDLVGGAYAGQSTGERLAVASGDGTGAFRPAVLHQQIAGSADPIVADVDRDGHLDVVADDAPQNVVVFPGTGGGALGTPTHLPAGGEHSAQVLSDLTGDGRGDVAVLDSSNRHELVVFAGRRRPPARRGTVLRASPRRLDARPRRCVQFRLRTAHRELVRRARLRFADVDRPFDRRGRATVCRWLTGGHYLAFVTAHGRTAATATVEVG
jgi:hypothetical protein